MFLTFVVYIYIFSYYVDHIYPNELVIKDTTNTDRSASYHDLHLEIDNEGWFTMKRDNFNLPNVKCSLICSLIPAACGVYLSQWIRYSRADGACHDFLDRRLLVFKWMSPPWHACPSIYGPFNFKHSSATSLCQCNLRYLETTSAVDDNLQKSIDGSL